MAMAPHSGCGSEFLSEAVFHSGLCFPASVAVLIPAWNPGPELLALAHSLVSMNCRNILVVDDGSGSAAQSIFERLQDIAGVRLLRHARNFGKGRALQTGLRAFLTGLPQYTGVVTADADGQHAPEDIARVATALAQAPQHLTLGVRCFPADMPFRSRFGNVLTRHVFHLVTGVLLADTQTGLRGLPRTVIPELLSLPGNRYEYEMAVLAHWCRSGRTPVEIPIQTIYTDGNRSSHFHPVRDSLSIYRTLVRHMWKK